MNNALIESLLKALEFSPENIELRFQIAKMYTDALNYEEAEKHLLFILDKQPKAAYKFFLAECYFKQKKYNLTDVILEELIDNEEHIDYLELQCSSHIEQNQNEEALAVYQRILEIDNHYRNDDFESLFKVAIEDFDDDFIDEDAIHFLKKPDVNFDSVGVWIK